MSIKCGHSLIVETCEHCLEIQEQWYEKLKKKGFNDIEDKHLRILKKWTGSTDLVDIFKIQEPNEEIQSSWPETYFNKESEFLHNPNFIEICQDVFKHGNNAISATIMLHIWEGYCDGLSYRELEKRFHIQYTTIFRAVTRIKEMANLMSDDSKTIIKRDYDPQIDTSFIFSTWRKCLWFDEHPDSENQPGSNFCITLNRKINLLLREPTTHIKIACLQDDPGQIAGYAVLSNETLEFVYIKLDYRNQGIAKLLTKGFRDIVYPMTKIGKAIADKKNLRIKGELDGKKEDKYADSLCEVSSASSPSRE